MTDEETIRRQYEMLRPALDERARRLFAASHVQIRGGIAAVSRATGIAPSTIGRGLKELDQGVAVDQRLRRPGGGRKRLADTDPSLVSDLLSLIEPATLGDPERLLLWSRRVRKSWRRRCARWGIRSRPTRSAACCAVSDNRLRRCLKAQSPG